MDAVLYSACIFSLILSNLIVLDGINKTLYTLIFSLHNAWTSDFVSQCMDFDV